MEIRQLTCICCPIGCSLQVELTGESVEVTGNRCRRGAIYGEKEVIAPVRSVTTTVRLQGGGVLPVKTKEEIPKGKIMAIVKELKALEIAGPVHSGETILENVAGTGVAVIATACG